MLENSSELNAVGQDHSSSSISINNRNEDPKLNVTKDDNHFGATIVESTYRSILDELIDDAVLDVCFEVHRAEKINNFLVENSEKHFKYQVKEQQKTVVCCPICHLTKGAKNFTTHLSVCMGISTKRKASQKIISFEESDSESEDQDSGSEDFVPGASKKKRKGNKNVRKQTKLQGNSVSKQYLNTNSNYQHMSNEDKRAFFNENCGVISKRTKRLCTKTLNCSQHTDEQRRDVRNDLLRDRSDQIANEEEIDVDTVEEDISLQYTMPS